MPVFQFKAIQADGAVAEGQLERRVNCAQCDARHVRRFRQVAGPYLCPRCEDGILEQRIAREWED